MHGQLIFTWYIGDQTTINEVYESNSLYKSISQVRETYTQSFQIKIKDVRSKKTW